jgi:hypothetical protein
MLGSHDLGDVPASSAGSNGATGRLGKNVEELGADVAGATTRPSCVHSGRRRNTFVLDLGFDRGDIAAALDLGDDRE